MKKVLNVLGQIVFSVIVVLAFFICAVAGLAIIGSIGFGLYLHIILVFIISAITGVFSIMMLRFLTNKARFSKKIGIPYLIILAICIASWIGYNAYDKYQRNIPVIKERQVNLLDYMPFKKNKDVAKLDESSTLLISDNFPKLDGATAFFPVYSAFVEAIYDEMAFTRANGNDSKSSNTEIHGNILKCSRTEQAYENLINRQVDIIFVLAPSDEQLELAKQRSAELEFIPIGKEAFVFFVNSKNKVNSLTVSQVQDIYSGKITNWKSVGGKRQNIKAFQRNKNSGSQTALENLMKGRTIIKPDYQTGAMGLMTESVADYKNYNGAIGYSFRYFTTEMETNNNLKLLEINGVYPSKETVENGTYPLINDFYAVVRKNSNNENVDKLINWILSSQGQELIRKTGYAGI